MEKNIMECLSKLIQIRFFWLSSHITRAIFFKLVDDNSITPHMNIKYSFSEQDKEPSIPINWFVNLYQKNDIQEARESYMTFIRKTIILEAQTEIKECFKNKGIELNDLKLDDDELTAFRFLGLSRNALFHWNGLKKNEDAPLTWNDITIDNSRETLKIKDVDIDLLLKTLIESLIKRLPIEKIVNQDLRMSLDIDSIQKIAQDRFKGYEVVMKSYFG